MKHPLLRQSPIRLSRPKTIVKITATKSNTVQECEFYTPECIPGHIACMIWWWKCRRWISFASVCVRFATYTYIYLSKEEGKKLAHISIQNMSYAIKVDFWNMEYFTNVVTYNHTVHGFHTSTIHTPKAILMISLQFGTYCNSNW